MKRYDYRGKTIVVTGGAGDIAWAFAQRAALRGAAIILVDIREDALSAAISRLPGAGHRHHACDLTDQRQVEQLIAAIEDEAGRIDVLVNTIGMTSAERFEERSVESIRHELEVNLLSPLMLTRLAIPLLHESSDPRVITTVSLGGIFPLGETPIYTSSKFGLRGAMLSIGLDLRARGITAGSVLPSATDTRMLRQEAVEGGNALQFRGTPQTPSAVARTMLRMLDAPRLERYPRSGESWLVRVAMLFPNALPLMMLPFTGQGERGMAAYLKRLERAGYVVRRDGAYVLTEQH